MHPLPFTDMPDHICCIDTLYQRPGLAACYLIESAGEAALIDTGTAPRSPGLLALLAHKGVAPTQIRYLIPTHVHLDHAGAAGQLMRALPAAQLVVHPRGGPSPDRPEQIDRRGHGGVRRGKLQDPLW
jgi:glyoxylase-like metal-dependent hydrolase (beta-lactamase superfamily II)